MTRKEKLFVLKENISKAEENGATYVGARLTNTRRFQCKPAILNILLSPFGKKKFQRSVLCANAMPYKDIHVTLANKNCSDQRGLMEVEHQNHGK